MILDFNFQLIGLDGKEMQGENNNTGKILAGALAYAPKGDSLKLMDWAKKLHKGEVLDLDPSDKQTLETFIKEIQGLPRITEAQMLEVFFDKPEPKKK